LLVSFTLLYASWLATLACTAVIAVSAAMLLSRWLRARLRYSRSQPYRCVLSTPPGGAGAKPRLALLL